MIRYQIKRVHIMNVGETVKDALKYPFSIKNFLILGFIFVIANLYDISGQFSQNAPLLIVLLFLGLLFCLITYGYIFKINKS